MSDRKSRKSSATRRSFLQSAVIGGAVASLAPLSPALGGARHVPANESSAPAHNIKPFELEESTIAELQAGMKSGKFTARSLIEKYQQRIAEIDKRGPALNSIIELNPDAISIADGLDKERRTEGFVGRCTAFLSSSRTTLIQPTT